LVPKEKPARLAKRGGNGGKKEDDGEQKERRKKLLEVSEKRGVLTKARKEKRTSRRKSKGRVNARDRVTAANWGDLDPAGNRLKRCKKKGKWSGGRSGGRDMYCPEYEGVGKAGGGKEKKTRGIPLPSCRVEEGGGMHKRGTKNLRGWDRSGREVFRRFGGEESSEPKGKW